MLHCLLDKQLNSMLLLESLFSFFGIFKPELMPFVALFTGQTAEHYVIAGVTLLFSCLSSKQCNIRHQFWLKNTNN
jgi:hypothetical protein